MTNDLSNQQSSFAESNGPGNRTHFLNRFGPEQIGRAAAISHGLPEWHGTDAYVAERLSMLDQAFRRLRDVLAHDPNNESGLLLHRQLEAATATVAKELPPELPFLTGRSAIRLRLRVAALTREWLLTADSDPRLEDFRSYLVAYQQVSPLYFTEIRLVPTALRLAAAEKCHILPCPGTSGHIDLIPRLLDDLAQTCRLIVDTDWKSFGEQVSQVHSLLVRDPSRLYLQMDFATRDGYRETVETLSRLARISETKTAERALHLAQREETRVAHFLEGPGRQSLFDNLMNEPPSPDRPALPENPALGEGTIG